MPVRRQPRRLWLAVCCATLAACAGPQRWSKPGVDASASAKDASECEIIGRQEAQRLYPYTAGSGPYGSTGMILSQQQDNANRSSVQVSVFNACMQRRGYVRASGS